MIKFDRVSKKYKNGTIALEDINLTVENNEFLFLTGPSGAGKSTIIRLLMRDLLPSEGNITINDWKVNKIPKVKIPIFRRKIGVVFQELKLLTDRTVFENVALALEVFGKKGKELKSLVKETLEKVGLPGFEDKFPVQLSGGELQRTAIARAIIKNPDILLADEPTAELDPAISQDIINLLTQINDTGTTVIMATHNIEVVKDFGKRAIALDKGKIVSDEKKKN